MPGAPPEGDGIIALRLEGPAQSVEFRRDSLIREHVTDGVCETLSGSEAIAFWRDWRGGPVVGASRPSGLAYLGGTRARCGAGAGDIAGARCSLVSRLGRRSVMGRSCRNRRCRRRNHPRCDPRARGPRHRARDARQGLAGLARLYTSVRATAGAARRIVAPSQRCLRPGAHPQPGPNGRGQPIQPIQQTLEKGFRRSFNRQKNSAGSASSASISSGLGSREEQHGRVSHTSRGGVSAAVSP